MNYFLLSSFLIVLNINSACSDNNQELDTSKQTPEPIIGLTEETYPFETTFLIEYLENDLYSFSVVMEVDSGSYFGSPYSNNDFTGLFGIDFGNGEFISLRDSLDENPKSKPSFDYFSESYVNWVKETTTYTQKIEFKNQNDNEYLGVVSFVIEPICNRYEVSFKIIQKQGQVSVIKLGQKVANISS